MNDQKFKEFSTELEQLVVKYKITDSAFTGHCDDKYIGMLMPNDPTRLFFTAIN